MNADQSVLADAYGGLAAAVAGVDSARALVAVVDLASRVVEALLEHPLPGWSDERVAVVGTGRAASTADEIADLGPASDCLPVFS